MTDDMEAPNPKRLIGVLLIATAALSIFAMAHHPAGAGQIGLGHVVHGVLMILLIVQAIALIACFDPRRHLLNLAGAGFFLSGVVAGLVAATINGFVAPGLLLQGIKEPALYRFAWTFNQALASEGVVAIGIAYACWSLLLVKEGHSLIGGLGLMIGLGTAGSLVTGLADMHLHGAIAIYSLQWLWLVIVGASLLRRQDSAAH